MRKTRCLHIFKTKPKLWHLWISLITLHIYAMKATLNTCIVFKFFFKFILLFNKTKWPKKRKKQCNTFLWQRLQGTIRNSSILATLSMHGSMQGADYTDNEQLQGGVVFRVRLMSPPGISLRYQLNAIVSISRLRGETEGFTTSCSNTKHTGRFFVQTVIKSHLMTSTTSYFPTLPPISSSSRARERTHPTL